MYVAIPAQATSVPSPCVTEPLDQLYTRPMFPTLTVQQAEQKAKKEAEQKAKIKAAQKAKQRAEQKARKEADQRRRAPRSCGVWAPKSRTSRGSLPCERARIPCRPSLHTAPRPPDRPSPPPPHAPPPDACPTRSVVVCLDVAAAAKPEDKKSVYHISVRVD